MNLMLNAVKFTYNGCIELIIDYDDHTKLIIGRVKDTGIGISPEDQDALF